MDKSLSYRFFLTLFAFFVLLNSSTTYSDSVPNGAVRLAANKKFRSDDGFLCGKIGNKYVPVRKLAGGYFYPLTAERADTLAQIPRSSGAKRTRLIEKALDLKFKIFERKPVCAIGFKITRKVIAGGNHSCALDKVGGVWCWGANNSGQLGNGSFTSSSVPVSVTGLTKGVRDITAGFQHNCAVTRKGGVKCWGLNSDGQLGAITGGPRNTPVDVVTLSEGVRQVSAGIYHTCALTTSSGLKCWGDNSFGQLGDGTFSLSYIPRDVSSLTSNVRAFDSGDFHNCATKRINSSDSLLMCWGQNTWGQLGNGGTTNSAIPVNTAGISLTVSAFSAGGSTTCAIDGNTKCWGANWRSQLGRSTAGAFSATAGAVEFLSDVDTIFVAYEHVCARTTAGGAKCWGNNNSGQTGYSLADEHLEPRDAEEATADVRMLSLGDFHTCALMTNQSVKCWGRNSEGQIGDGMPIDPP
jgi:alpha-tubulin suppressor-like RCC1 family protein